MKTCYINGVGSVSAQKTHEGNFLNETTIHDNQNVLFALQPSYKEIIPPAMIRRMAKGVKMGIFASNKALEEAGINYPDAIITGTGMGCVEDSEKFLKAIIDNQEQFLTPTSFIQSTHNTVAGQIALGLQCKSYNFTYVNGAVSFETALLDGKMQIETGEAESVLVGGIDETSSHTLELYKLVNIIKKEEDKPFSIKNTKTTGVVFSEGATFFTLSNQLKESTYAKVEAISLQNILDKEEIQDFVRKFLLEQKIDLEAIDALVLGYNGDVHYDVFYDKVASMFSSTSQLYYKNISGEYNTASAFGLWIASHLIKKQEIPEVLEWNGIKPTSLKKVLLYNQYQGRDHSLVLLTQC
ncbi:3-oxoacyl-ACP synthase [Flavobacterium columnare NBRC 100251 = ATCC 23463]|uniref:3-oxoacyl-(Acyl-carrier-protein) synthase n=2 Tax=Flavobacterium columnare TaxID=996 RepID=G8X844_FLACA|nr:beta-ketoacyl synthase N-terminal-like domain-containing protein [Flavobacterium columnare]AEW87158.1 3-oxoacyl-(acyl-carrier-protein) synthase [Flavobacterium columnare ATCC 49512]AMO20982.1 3-oxoacyl-ACP synthase [Flavobacterium columnare]ANO47525.1 3-oxoacyl-(acyl-carrier-protein) synthase [Flavobacterium columnare]APT21839.1 3-oxoacyl-ACP synthase [Flavobacterium columnare]AUX18982.1 3-oxoacyl-ACP synthase [Flavobacterium columnare]